MIEKTLSIRNDVPGDFLELFTAGGPFGQLTELGRTPRNTVDLQFRNTQGVKPWATLYLGTSKIVDISFDERRHRLKIKPQESKGIFKDALHEFWVAHSDLKGRWGTWESMDAAADSWNRGGADLVHHLTSAKDQAAKFVGTSNEGYLQAGIAKPDFFDRWAIINRESIVSFEGDAQRQRIRGEVLEPVDETLRNLWSTNEPWTRGKKGFGDLRAEGGKPASPSGFGNKLDALGIDNEGNVLAIEVKGGYDTAGVGWTPAQVMVYTRLLEQWLKHTSEDPLEILGRSLKQRQALDLAGPQELAADFKIIPVIVIGEIANSGSAKEATRRMNLVWDELEKTGDDLKNLRVYQLEGEALACFEIGRGELLRTYCQPD